MNSQAQIHPCTVPGEIRSVFFDLNGTLVDDLPRATWGTNEVLAAGGFDGLNESQFRASYCVPLTAFFAALGLQPDQLEAAVASWNSALATRTAPAMPGAARLSGNEPATSTAGPTVVAAARAGP